MATHITYRTKDSHVDPETVAGDTLKVQKRSIVSYMLRAFESWQFAKFRLGKDASWRPSLLVLYLTRLNTEPEQWRWRLKVTFLNFWSWKLLSAARGGHLNEREVLKHRSAMTVINLNAPALLYLSFVLGANMKLIRLLKQQANSSVIPSDQWGSRRHSDIKRCARDYTNTMTQKVQHEKQKQNS
jgi:hypothetical protein